MNVVELIERKRDGGRLTDDEIRSLIEAYTAERIPDYQVAALLMAIVWRGLSDDELATWTDAMLHSGDVMDLSGIDRPKVDKHSTGGVGDKISLPLAPLVAACGVAVPMMSGRGLGHTGGTLDKLESIPGFTVQLDRERFAAVLGDHGMVMAGQSSSLVPADRRLYALRDATGTVPAIPLITSSIMSKKLAEDLDGLVLDVKVGNGAFLPDPAAARELALTMIGVGRTHDTPVTALVTDMSQPLGNEIGNANEMAESIAVLRGEGPPDVVDLTLALGAEMLMLGGVTGDPDEAEARLQAARASGKALDLFAGVIEAQGGDPAVLEDPSLLPSAPGEHVVEAPEAGIVTDCHARRVGVSAVRLGAGRATKEDDVDHGVGITLHAKVGDRVEAGDPIATVRWRDEDRLAACLELLPSAWTFGDEVDPPPLIHDRLA
ncbi:MAG: thymidine phosphorylase [Acidimicrobiia bacterium]